MILTKIFNLSTRMHGTETALLTTDFGKFREMALTVSQLEAFEAIYKENVLLTILFQQTFYAIIISWQ